MTFLRIKIFIFGDFMEPSIWERARQWVLYKRCERNGHNWKDVSYAGPDSGNMALECTECGEYWEYPLY